MAAAVGPEDTVAAPLVVPVALASWSTAAAPAAVESPAYSSTVAPTSADPDAVTFTTGFVPPPAVMGAAQMESSVLSEAVKWSSSV